ncbi:MAG: ribosome maturation factor RimM [Halanaerobium sp.]|nr:ribosome maturation factor RimM [Halanaerobium sp.]
MVSDMVKIGVITKPHGIKGEVRVLPLTDHPERFEELQRVFLIVPEDIAAASSGSLDIYSLATEGREVEDIAYIQNMIIMKLQGINDRDMAEELRNFTVEIPLAERLQLPEGHYFISDLLGMQVVTTEGRELGLIKDVITTGGTDIYVTEKEGIMIPATKEVVKEVDLPGRKMTVALIDGLEELRVK